MIPDDAPRKVVPAEPVQARRGARLLFVMGGFFFVFLGGSLLLWFLRKPAAEQALSAWCAERDLLCDASFTELDTSGLTVSAVRVSSGASVAAQALQVRADIRWSGLFTPEVTGVTVNGLSLRGTLDAEGLRFGGLERLAISGGERSGPAPAIDIRDARIVLDTPAGQAGATLNLSGVLPRDGVLSLQLDPALLSNPLARADLRAGRLDARAVDGQVEAELGVVISQASLQDYGLEAFDLLARAEFNEDTGHPGAFEWSLRAGRIASPAVRATDLRSAGRVELAQIPGASVVSVLNEISGAVFEGEAGSLTLSGYTFNSAGLSGELAGRAGDVSGPLIASTGIVTGPAGSVTALSLAGEIQRKTGGGAGFEGKLTASGAALDSDLRARAGAAFSLPGVLAGHAGALRASLNRALENFDAQFSLRLQEEATAFTASAMGEGIFDAASGLSLRAVPAAGGAWVTLSRDSLAAEGSIALSGGGAPSVSAEVARFAYLPEGISLAAGTFRLSSWTVGGRELSANLNSIKLDSRPDGLVVAGAGELSFAGEAGGVTLARTRLQGGLDAAWDETGWRVQATGARCLAVDTQGLRIGAIAVEPTKLDVCPANGRFMRQSAVPGGAAQLGNLKLPFTMESGDGILSLAGAEIDWTARQGFALTLSAGNLDLPLKIGERTLTISGTAPRIDVATGKGPARIAARLGATIFGGTMVPASVSAGAFTFDGSSAEAGVEGTVTGKGVVITDRNADPVYTPVAAAFSGTVGDNRLRIAGPLSLRSTGTPLADAALDINILKLDGTARVMSRPLAFRRGGLQPNMISDRLTGLFTDATGNVTSDARFTIAGGKITGVADVSIRDFGFQTTRLGRVSGVNGSINFADLMGLQTARDQVLTVASINPGVPLTDGRIVYDLREGAILHLESVTFPFGGGKLAVAPFDWALEGGLEDQSVAVTADAINLAQLVEILKLPDTQATGTLSGTFPIMFSENRIQINGARLKADDPGGRLSYTGGAVDAAAGQDANASLAFAALRDLRFEVLEIGIDGDLSGELRADLLLEGENINPLPMGNRLTLPAGQAFEFAIGFDLPIGKLIENNLGFVDQKDLIDATLELLNAEDLPGDAGPAGPAKPGSE